MSRSRSMVLALAGALALAACSAAPTGAPSAGPDVTAGTISIPGTNGPGVSDTEIRIVVDEMFEFNEPTFRAVAKVLNDAGGIAGRKIVLQPLASFQSSGNEPPDVVDRATCQKVADDPAGFLGIINDAQSLAFHQCFGTTKMFSIMGSSYPVDPRTLEASPFTAGPGITDTRLAQAYADQLISSKFVKPGEKVVVLTSEGLLDSGAVTAVNEVLVPALKKAGIDDIETVVQQEVFDDGDAVNQGTGLKIKTLSPDKVVVYGWSFGLSPTIAAAVEQGVTAPVAGMATASSTGDPDATGFGLELAGEAQKSESRFLSTTKELTRSESAKLLAGSGLPGASEALLACAKIVSDAKLDSIQLGFGLKACEQLDLLKNALAASGSDAVNAEAFLVGLSKLGKQDSLTAFGDVGHPTSETESPQPVG